MAWPYEFRSLSDEEKELRRQSLAFYAAVAHLSAFAPPLASLLFRLVRNASSRLGSRDGGSYEAVPGSPAVKSRRLSGLGGWSSRWARLAWWMGDDVYFRGRHWGQRDEWVVGLSWTAWLLVLCVLGTGSDYLHLTKRFGLIATTQLPIQYLLALKPLNPFSWALTSSHEHLNRYHRVLGRATYTLLLLHILFYNIFFLATGIWSKRIVAPVVLYGVFASLLLHAVMFTASSAVRSRSYRLFYLTHWLAVRLIPGLIFLHAPSSRVYIIEGAILLIIDYIARHRRTISNAPSTFDTVPGTNLIKVEATLPLPNLPKFQTHPGSHVFIRLPSSTRPSQSLFSPSGYSFELIRHPFTVSAVNSDSITLIARKRAGPLTKHLSTLSGSHGTLDVQGPYGAIGKTLPSLLTGEYDRILLFAGGVGATFALPVYRTILSYKPSAHVTLIWAVRSAAEATWAVSPTPGAGGGSVLDDRNVQLFLTGDMGVADTSTGEVEMTDLRRDGRGGGGGNRKRPDVRRIVDDTFRKGLEESVAVMVCGPDGMARDVRESVRPWLMKGRRVWWHNEAFGW